MIQWLIRVNANPKDMAGWKNFAWTDPNDPEADKILKIARAKYPLVSVFKCEVVQIYKREEN